MVWWIIHHYMVDCQEAFRGFRERIRGESATDRSFRREKKRRLAGYFFRLRSSIGAFSRLRSSQFWYRSTLNISISVKITIHSGM